MGPSSGTPEPQDLRTPWKSPVSFELQNLNTPPPPQPPETWKLKHKLKAFSLNYIVEQSETKAGKVLLIISLLTMIVRGMSSPLLPSTMPMLSTEMAIKDI